MLYECLLQGQIYPPQCLRELYRSQGQERCDWNHTGIATGNPKKTIYLDNNQEQN